MSRVVRTAVRIRPFLERDVDTEVAVRTLDGADAQVEVVFSEFDEPAVLQFDDAFDGSDSCETVYETLVRGMVQDFIDDGTGASSKPHSTMAPSTARALCLYGVTGSGKTFTFDGVVRRVVEQTTAALAMNGDDDNDDADSNDDNDGGSQEDDEDGEPAPRRRSTSRSRKDKKKQLQKQPARRPVNSFLQVCAVELYNDHLFDIGRLEPAPIACPAGVNPLTCVCWCDVQGAEDWEAIIDNVRANRSLQSTQMNLTSSRSHVLLLLRMVSVAAPPPASARGSRRGTQDDAASQQQQQGTPLAGQTLIVRSQLCFCDLAGCERVSRSHATGDRLKEARYINASLASLGNVIHSLNAKGRQQQQQQQQLRGGGGPSNGGSMLLGRGTAGASSMRGGAAQSAVAGRRTNSPFGSSSRSSSVASRGGSGAVSAPNLLAPAAHIHVPYRDSKLTWLLSDFFVGASAGHGGLTVVVTVSPAMADSAETLTALRFGARARGIMICPPAKVHSRVDDHHHHQGGAAAAVAPSSSSTGSLATARRSASAARSEQLHRMRELPADVAQGFSSGPTTPRGNAAASARGGGRNGSAAAAGGLTPRNGAATPRSNSVTQQQMMMAQPTSNRARSQSQAQSSVAALSSTRQHPQPSSSRRHAASRNGEDDLDEEDRDRSFELQAPDDEDEEDDADAEARYIAARRHLQKTGARAAAASAAVTAEKLAARCAAAVFGTKKKPAIAVVSPPPRVKTASGGSAARHNHHNASKKHAGDHHDGDGDDEEEEQEGAAARNLTEEEFDFVTEPLKKRIDELENLLVFINDDASRQIKELRAEKEQVAARAAEREASAVEAESRVAVLNERLQGLEAETRRFVAEIEGSRRRADNAEALLLEEQRDAAQVRSERDALLDGQRAVVDVLGLFSSGRVTALDAAQVRGFFEWMLGELEAKQQGKDRDAAALAERVAALERELEGTRLEYAATLRAQAAAVQMMDSASSPVAWPRSATCDTAASPVHHMLLDAASSRAPSVARQQQQQQQHVSASASPSRMSATEAALSAMRARSEAGNTAVVQQQQHRAPSAGGSIRESLLADLDVLNRGGMPLAAALQQGAAMLQTSSVRRAPSTASAAQHTNFGFVSPSVVEQQQQQHYQEQMDHLRVISRAQSVASVAQQQQTQQQQQQQPSVLFSSNNYGLGAAPALPKQQPGTTRVVERSPPSASKKRQQEPQLRNSDQSITSAASSSSASFEARRAEMAQRTAALNAALQPLETAPEGESSLQRLRRTLQASTSYAQTAPANSYFAPQPQQATAAHAASGFTSAAAPRRSGLGAVPNQNTATASRLFGVSHNDENNASSTSTTSSVNSSSASQIQSQHSKDFLAAASSLLSPLIQQGGRGENGQRLAVQMSPLDASRSGFWHQNQNQNQKAPVTAL